MSTTEIWEYTCGICGKRTTEVHRAIKCLECKKYLCKTCSKYGLCPADYAKLPQAGKEHIEKVKKKVMVYGLLGIVIGIALMFPALSQMMDGSNSEPSNVSILTYLGGIVLITGLVLVIGMVMLPEQILRKTVIKALRMGTTTSTP